MRNNKSILFLILCLSGPVLLLNSMSQIEPQYSNPELSQFTADKLDGYQYPQQVMEDLRIIGYNLASTYIENQNYWWGYDDLYYKEGLVLEESALDNAVPMLRSSTEQAELGDVREMDSAGYETNNQVEGVSEGDIVKSDGRFIYLIYGTDLVSMDLDGNVVSIHTLGEQHYFNNLYMVDGFLYALGQNYYENTTIVKEFSSYNGELFLDQEQSYSGTLTNSRIFNGKLYIITNHYFDQQIFYNEFYNDYYYDSNKPFAYEDYRRAAYAKIDEVVEIWAKEVFDSLFRNGNRVDYDFLANTIRAFNFVPEYNYENSYYNYYYWDYPQISSFQRVSTIDLSESLEVLTSSGAFTSGYGWGNMYMSSEILVSATNSWYYDEAGNWQSYTYLLSFGIDDELGATPKSVAVMDGYLLNQFSLDYYDGHLRVAVTEEAKWSYDERRGSREISPSESFIYIMNLESPEAEVVSVLSGIGETETIYSVRFMGDRGYVVTFRQMDPFYTLDLSDPENPEVMGELKIPGFSNYLHPVGEDHILAIGQDATDEGRVLGMQVALFDVSDLSNPIQLHKETDHSGTYSDAQWDHHAFRYLHSKELLIIPVQDYGRRVFGGNFPRNYFNVYQVSIEDGINELATIVHDDNKSYYDYYSYLSGRSMVFGDQLVTMRDASIYSHSLWSWEEEWEINLHKRLRTNRRW